MKEDILKVVHRTVMLQGSSGGFEAVCVQEAGQCQAAQNSGRDSQAAISGDTQDCS